MGFDSELEDSGSECDVEGQRQNAIKTAILGKLVKKSTKKMFTKILFFSQKQILQTICPFLKTNYSMDYNSG